MSQKVQLKVVKGDKTGRLIACDDGEMVFGRSKECKKGMLPENDMTTSRLHFKLEVKGKQVRLWDTQSTFGTLVNGKKYGGSGGSKSGKVSLRNGDRIQAGEQVFEVMIAGDNPAKGDIPTASLGGLKFTMAGGPPAIQGYKIQEKLKRGGPGSSYLCKRENDGTLLVIRVLRSAGVMDERTVNELHETVGPLCAMRHPNVAHVCDYGFTNSADAGTAFCFETEWCSFGSVGEIAQAQNGRMPVHAAYDFMLGALAGLSYAHEQGIVHGSIRPFNILVAALAGEKFAKIGDFADFALSRVFRRVGSRSLAAPADDVDVTPFMARELAANPSVAEPHSDVWSVGAVFYNLLTGEYPRESSVYANQLEVALKAEPVSIRNRRQFNRKVPKGLSTLLDFIDRSLALSPEDRFGNASEMYNALKCIPRPKVVNVE